MNIVNSAKSIAHKNPVPITRYLNDRNRIINANVADSPAIYLFWYRNNDPGLQALSRELRVIGPGRQLYPLTIWDWNMEQDYVCLYVGSSTSLRGRLGRQGRLSQHLLTGTPENIYILHAAYIAEIYREFGDDAGRIRARPRNNTSCQFRSGFDFLYREQPETIIFDEIRERIYITIHYEDDFVTRYYLKHYLIGMLQPWFNLDGER